MMSADCQPIEAGERIVVQTIPRLPRRSPILVHWFRERQGRKIVGDHRRRLLSEEGNRAAQNRDALEEPPSDSVIEPRRMSNVLNAD
jgi:hypothetical protein